MCWLMIISFFLLRCFCRSNLRAKADANVRLHLDTKGLRAPSSQSFRNCLAVRAEAGFLAPGSILRLEISDLNFGLRLIA
jgi:hypothetical protein